MTLSKYFASYWRSAQKTESSPKTNQLGELVESEAIVVIKGGQEANEEFTSLLKIPIEDRV